ncbi:MAG: hypothetical protein F4042_09495 [Gemmatimonadetes bacterium]|nr:hypothetical protein [Gemmatimonadota bacterium]MYJ90063.1 hypothetical protein [Gemmatimonadota bacterium]
MGDDKVKESPAEVFATVTEVNSLFHSLEDMLATRFEAIDGKFGVVVEKLAEMDARNEGRFAAIDGRIGVLEKNLVEMDARNEGRFAAIEKNLAEMDAKYERRFEAIDGRIGVLDEKLTAMDARNGVQFATLEQMIVELDTKTEGRFDLVEQKFKSQELKIEHFVTSANNKLMVLLLVIAGSIIAGLLYGG